MTSKLIKNTLNLKNIDFKNLFDRVIEDLKSHPKVVGISLHGSLISGEQDEFSDVDLDILLWRNWKDWERMRKDFEKMVKGWPKPDPVVMKKRWYVLGFDWGIRIIGRYVFDFNFEPVQSFSIPEIEKVLSCEKLDTEGIRDIVEGKILYDPRNLFAEFKRKLRKYPPKLSRRIVEKRQSCLHKDYFMIKTNMGRRDTHAVAFSMAQFFEDSAHLLFALNQQWYPGTKRLAKNLRRLKILPPDYVSLMEKALHPTTINQPDDLEKIIDKLYSRIRSLHYPKELQHPT
jgi:predicted nucleotidyltransferase